MAIAGYVEGQMQGGAVVAVGEERIAMAIVHPQPARAGPAKRPKAGTPGVPDAPGATLAA